MQYSALIALAIAAAASVQATPIKRDQIVCDSLVDPTYRLKDIKAPLYPQAHAKTNIIASEGLVAADSNNVFYELYNDNPDLATHFYVQQCNTTALNLNKDTMQGDAPIKLVYRDDISLCASAESVSDAAATSTPLQLKQCLAVDDLSQASQFWALKPDGKTVAFVGNYQDNSQSYWTSETGGGDSYRTPSVAANPCAYNDQNCRNGEINWEIVIDN